MKILFLLALLLPLLVVAGIWFSVLYRVLTRKDFDTSSRILWVIVIIFVPLLGLVLYWIASPANTVPAPQAAESPRKGPFSYIPPKNPELYSHARTWESWQNPSLLITNEGIFVNDSPTETPVEDLLDKLASLPAAAWPYGRIVAISAFSGLTSRVDAEEQKEVVRRILDILKSADVDADVWPAQ